MTTLPDRVPSHVGQQRRCSWRRLVQFSIRTLLLLMTAAAVACWWLLQPERRHEQVFQKYLTRRAQVRVVKVPADPFVTSTAKRAARLTAAMQKQVDAVIHVGQWQLRNDRGDLLVDGQVENGVPTGRWIAYHANGRQAVEGQLLDGARIGLWRVWDTEGRLVSEATYEAIEPVDVESPPGYFITRRRERLEGAARAWHPSGQPKFAGQYAGGRRSGRWTFFNEAGQVRATTEYDADPKRVHSKVPEGSAASGQPITPGEATLRQGY